LDLISASLGSFGNFISSALVVLVGIVIFGVPIVLIAMLLHKALGEKQVK
jgi:hypothetical protein